MASPARATHAYRAKVRLPFVWVFLIQLAWGLNGSADTVRITTWNLSVQRGEAQAGGDDQFLTQAARTLDKLAPDVILLQGVRDWSMCANLAEALKPALYHVAICSSFSDPGGALTNRQVAILTKQKAFFSWSEAWRAGTNTSRYGGFAFAALQLPRQRIGVLSAQFDERSADGFVRQVISQIDAVKRWQVNQPQTFLLAGTIDDASQKRSTGRGKTVELLEAAGFPEAFLLVPPAQRATVRAKPGRPGTAADHFFVDAAGFAGAPQILPVTFADHYPITCDLELEPAKVAALYRDQADQAQAAVQEATRGIASGGSPSQAVAGRTALPWLATGLGALSVLGVVLLWLARRGFARPASGPALLPETSEGSRAALSSYTVVIAPNSVTGSGLEEPALPGVSRPVVHLEAPSNTQTHSTVWQQRALAAEARAEQAQSILRQGLLPGLQRWLKRAFTRKLISDRSQLLEAQQAATRHALHVDERLARIERQIQHQNRAYERRIEELTIELMAAKEENRELIRARIAQVRAEMEAARLRVIEQAQEEIDGQAS